MSVIASASSARRVQSAWRWVLLTHRWLGILVGLIVLLWCLSGVIMMYVRYPLSLRQVEDILFERGIDIRPAAGHIDKVFHVQFQFLIQQWKFRKK